jgi:hypothetical protein
MRLHEVENPLLEVVKHADLHCVEEVGLQEVAHDAGNKSKHVESSVNMARREFSITYLGGLSHLQLFIRSWVLSNICLIYEQKAAHHSRKRELLLVWCSHISWNCEKWQVVTGSRKIIS